MAANEIHLYMVVGYEPFDQYSLAAKSASDWGPGLSAVSGSKYGRGSQRSYEISKERTPSTWPYDSDFSITVTPNYVCNDW